jgi:disulfide bond formation protein DsbB
MTTLLITLLKPRNLNILIVLACSFAMFMVYYLDGVLGLEPCPLCLTQRVFVVFSGVISLLAVLHNPSTIGLRVYAALSGVSAAIGGGFAARHTWLQHLPEDLVPACGPDLQYMLDTLPFTETLELLLMGDGNCAEVLWTFMGLSIPEQSLILFIGLCCANVWQMLRRDVQGAKNHAG